MDIAEEKKFDDCIELVRHLSFKHPFSFHSAHHYLLSLFSYFSLPPPLSLSPSLPLSLPLSPLSQLQDASRKKYSKCEHIDIDWGVSNGDCESESIYQTPVDLGHGSGNGGMKRSETEDNIIGGGVGNGSMEKNLGLPLLSTG